MVIHPDGEARSTVFYYPGCGSERLHSDISLASIFLLLHAGIRVVLPPQYLCCGFPARANAKADLCTRQELRNTIIFTQIRSMLGYLQFDGCVISCGTCQEALHRIWADEIFGAPIVDICKYLLGNGLAVQLQGAWQYHAPCHDSLQGEGLTILSQLTGNEVVASPHCCSEAGTLALSRPDIAATMLNRKRSTVRAKQDVNKGQSQLITNCPACLNGLGRLAHTHPTHMAVALAGAIDSSHWRRMVLQRMALADRIRF